MSVLVHKNLGVGVCIAIAQLVVSLTSIAVSWTTTECQNK